MPEAPILTVMRDIHLPADPGWWPLAPGWWLLLILILTVITVGIRVWMQGQSLQREALRELRRINHEYREHGQTDRLSMEINILLRRVALAKTPNSLVAGLTGKEWLEFLDKRGGNGRFSKGPGQILATAPYHHASQEMDVDALMRLAIGWIRSNA